MKRFSAICAAILFAIAGSAEEPSEFAKAQAELKRLAPEEFARIEKLAATDLSAAMQEFRAAARKHGIRIPRPTMSRGRRPFPDGGAPGAGPRRGRGGMGRGGRMGRGGNPLEQLIADAMIRKAFPQEFEAISTELGAAEAKMRLLAKRAGVNYPQGYGANIRMLRAAAPEKMAEIERLAADNPREAFRALAELMQAHGIGVGFGPGSERGRRGRPGEDPAPPEPRRLSRPPLRRLREAFPEEMTRYEALRQEDPEAAKKLLLELTRRLERERAGSGGGRR